MCVGKNFGLGLLAGTWVEGVAFAESFAVPSILGTAYAHSVGKKQQGKNGNSSARHRRRRQTTKHGDVRLLG
jgi:hypothetical protein